MEGLFECESPFLITRTPSESKYQISGRRRHLKVTCQTAPTLATCKLLAQHAWKLLRLVTARAGGLFPARREPYWVLICFAPDSLLAAKGWFHAGLRRPCRSGMTSARSAARSSPCRTTTSGRASVDTRSVHAPRLAAFPRLVTLTAVVPILWCSPPDLHVVLAPHQERPERTLPELPRRVSVSLLDLLFRGRAPSLFPTPFPTPTNATMASSAQPIVRAARRPAMRHLARPGAQAAA